MNETVISVEKLSKLYHLGKRQQYKTLRDAIANGLTALLQKFKPGLRSENEASNYIWALQDISFEIKKGEAVGIIGRNGAGKSTLLKILSRITPPSKGSAEVHGRVASLLEVGTGFHPELTGRDNIYLNGAILGMRRSEINAKFDEIMAFAEVEKFIDTPVKHYSSGMYMRLAFSVAAHLEPEILLVDEVLAVGDAAFQKKCLGKMGDIAKEGRTVLFVSHNMAAISRLCRKAIWLDKGKEYMSGVADKVVEAYLSMGASLSGQHQWERLEDAPGNDQVRLCAVRLLNSNNEVVATIEQNQHFYIEIEYEVFQDISDFQIGFWLLTADGAIIFVAGDREDPLWFGKKREAGCYVSRAKVPGGLLNSGRYIITTGFDLFGKTIIEEGVLQFNVELLNPPIHSAHGTWKPAGLLCLSLEWKISKR